MMKKKGFFVVAMAVCLIAAAGALLASNMGFKLNYQLTGPGAPNGTGRNTLSLPYFRQTGIDNAQQLMLDIGSGVITPVTTLSRYNEATDGFVAYTGRMGAGAPFALVGGESYLVQMTSTVNYIVVGAHDPSLVTSLDGPGAPGTGRNFYAPPYNITAANAQQLMTDIGGGVITPVTTVSRYNKSTDGFVAYTGRMGAGAPFALLPGEGYLVQMGSTVPYIASHY
jgi:hypothetical protein